MASEKTSSKPLIPSEDVLLRHLMLLVDSAWCNRLSKVEIEKWLANFKGLVFSVDYERRLALYLLTTFVYYNEGEVRHLCRKLFAEYLHWMLFDDEYKDSGDLASTLDSIVYTSGFSPLGKPGESGALVLYHFSQENRIATRQMADPQRPLSWEKTAVFVDDATVSGEQANEYLAMTRKSDRKVLLTFISSKDAADQVSKKGVHVISCITLDERSKSFSRESSLYRDFGGNFNDCKRFAEKYGERSMAHQAQPVEPLGYRNGQYAFGFFYNTPDNTLPIFWADNSEWTPIMKRYNKFKEVPYRDYPRFV